MASSDFQAFDLRQEMAAAHAAFAAFRVDEVADRCARILVNQPGFPPATFLLAMVSIRKGDLPAAIAGLRAVVEAEPNAFEAIEWLTNLLRDQGQFEESKRLSERLIQQRPTHPSGYMTKGLALQSEGHVTSALEWIQKAVQLAPTNSGMHFQLARAQEQLLRVDEAAESYRRAIDLAPGVPVLSQALGKLLFDNGRYSDCIDPLRRALEIAPAADGAMMLADALRHEARYDDAERCYRQAIELQPEAAAAHEALGSLLQVVGRFDEAEVELRRAIDLDPNSTGAYLRIAKARKNTAEDVDFVATLERMAADAGRSRLEQRNLNYVLGKAYADLGEYEKAMTRYDRANDFAFEVERKGVPFDPTGYRRLFDAQIATFSKGFFERNANLGSVSETPLLIVGMIRSGTTLVEQILSSHPQIGDAGELAFWTEADKAELVRLLTGGKIPASQLATAARDYLTLLADRAPGNPRVTDKMPLNYISLGLIRLLFPNAKIIHCRRHAVDTCLSIYMTPFAAAPEFCYRRDSIVEAHKEYSRLMAHWRSVIPDDRLLEIEYEQLVADTESVTRQMVAFIGLNWDDACLRHEQNERVVKTPSMWQVRQPIYKSSTEKWRQYEPWLREFRALL